MFEILIDCPVFFPLLNRVVFFPLGEFHEAEVRETECAAPVGVRLLEDQVRVVSATIVCFWGYLGIVVRNSDGDQQGKARCVAKSASSLEIFSYSSRLSTYLRSPWKKLWVSYISSGLDEGLVWVAMEGVSSGELSGKFGSTGEPDVDGPGSLLDWAETIGPLSSSVSEFEVLKSPVELK